MIAQRYARDTATFIHSLLTSSTSPRQNIGGNSGTVRAFAQRCARHAATFLHPTLAAIKHGHRGADGEIIRPIIEITGYPERKPVPPLALPAPLALPSDAVSATNLI
jgi:hypothetical protein